MNNSIWKKYLLSTVIVFIGILGVIGIYQDILIIQGQGALEASAIYGKYYAAALGSISFLFVQKVQRNRNNDARTLK